MIEPKLARQARSLLSNAIVSLMEDEHLGIITPPKPGADAAHAERLHQLGSDVATLASAMTVILRRSKRPSDAEA